jgi:hypothetical protein
MSINYEDKVGIKSSEPHSITPHVF